LGSQKITVDLINPVNQNEKQGIWIKLLHIRPRSNLVALLDGVSLEGLIMQECVITGYLPKDFIKKSGTFPLTIKDINSNFELYVGSVLVGS
jgi:hypothetical protein